MKERCRSVTEECRYNFNDVLSQCYINFRQVWFVFRRYTCVSVFSLEEGDCWSLDCKLTDILSSQNKWPGVITKN